MTIEKQQSENIEVFYKSFFENAREACIIVDSSDGLITGANKKAFSLFGLSRNEILNKNIIDIIQLNQKELILELIKVFSGKRDYFVINLEADSPTKRSFEVYPAKIDLNDNKFISLSFYDITETAKKLSFSLQYEKLLDFLMDESGDIIFICDLNGNLLYVSKKALELSGFSSKSQILWKNLFEDFFANKQLGSQIINEIRKTRLYSGENIIFRDNNQTQINLNLTAYASSTGDDLGSFFIAIIAHKEEDSSSHPEAVNPHFYKMEAVQQLAKGVAHEFNNILAGIIGFSEILEMEAGHNNRLKAYIDRIVVSANRGVGLVKDLNIFSQRTRPNLAVMDINDALRQFKKAVSEISNHGIDIQLVLSKEKIPVMADKNQIRIMLMHLFANARDAMPEGGVITISTDITTIDPKFKEVYGYGTPGKYALLYFVDQGSGIPEGLKEKIFEPFFTTKEVGKGTGLGLPIVYGIVKQHNGFITVGSGKKGTCFKIYLPYLLTPNELGFIMPPKGSEAILLAENNEILNVLIKDILEGYGYKVIVTSDAENAAEIISHNNQLSLALVNPDFKLKNGTRLYNFIKAANPELKIIFLNGPHHDIASLMLFDDKEKNVIRKPFSAAALLSSVREFIESKG
jgi:PAS domain S-box-containing protein